MQEDEWQHGFRRRRPKPFTVSGWALLGVAAVLVAAVFLFTRNGCDNEFAGFLRVRSLHVDTWAEWREHLQGIDLSVKYGALNVAYVADSIRADFVRRFPASIAGWPEGIRAWSDGTKLHVASASGQLWDNAAIKQWKTDLERKLKQGWSEMSDEEFLVYGTISGLFTSLELHGANGETTTIALPFYFEE